MNFLSCSALDLLGPCSLASIDVKFQLRSEWEHGHLVMITAYKQVKQPSGYEKEVKEFQTNSTLQSI